MKTAILLLSLLSLSCYSTGYRLQGHKQWAKDYQGAPPDIELSVGESRLALTRGGIGMPGGFAQGLASEHPEVVQVIYPEGSLNGNVLLLGKSEGTVRVHYGNAWVLPFYNGGQLLDKNSIQSLRKDQAESASSSRASALYFTVTVVERR